MNIVGAGEMLRGITGGFFKDKMAPALAEKFHGALQRGETKELAQILRQVKSMSQHGEQLLLKAVLGARGGEAEGKKGAAGFRELVMSALSPEQRQALAQELFSGGEMFGKKIALGTGSLEAKLDRFLLGIGGPDKRALPILRDGIEKPPERSFASLLRKAIGGPPREAGQLNAELRPGGNETPGQPAGGGAETDRIRAEMAKDPR
jgi:hypothetical protein